MGVDVVAVLPEEPDERDAAIPGEIDGEGGGGGNPGKDGGADREGFLNQLEGGATADEDDGMFGREAIRKEGPAGELVEGVVATDVLPKRQQFPAGGKEGGGMQAARTLKLLLGTAHGLGKRGEDGFPNPEPGARVHWV